MNHINATGHIYIKIRGASFTEIDRGAFTALVCPWRRQGRDCNAMAIFRTADRRGVTPAKIV
jgi:hypothetical protein